MKIYTRTAQTHNQWCLFQFHISVSSHHISPQNFNRCELSPRCWMKIHIIFQSIQIESIQIYRHRNRFSDLIQTVQESQHFWREKWKFSSWFRAVWFENVQIRFSVLYNFYLSFSMKKSAQTVNSFACNAEKCNEKNQQ